MPIWMLSIDETKTILTRNCPPRELLEREDGEAAVVERADGRSNVWKRLAKRGRCHHPKGTYRKRRYDAHAAKTCPVLVKYLVQYAAQVPGRVPDISSHLSTRVDACRLRSQEREETGENFSRAGWVPPQVPRNHPQSAACVLTSTVRLFSIRQILEGRRGTPRLWPTQTKLMVRVPISVVAHILLLVVCIPGVAKAVP